MACISPKNSTTFSQDTKATFALHLRENPHRRRVSPNEKRTLIEWVTNPHRRPTSQQEFSRRNYVRKTFSWDDRTQTLYAPATRNERAPRIVITTDMIADVVETIHENNGHAGWDTTWKDVSNSYYGILRSDIIFLLKRCETCSKNPLKRPKGAPASQTPQNDNGFSEDLDHNGAHLQNSNDPAQVGRDSGLHGDINDPAAFCDEPGLRTNSVTEA